MRTFFTLVFSGLFTVVMFGQNPLKNLSDKPYVTPLPLRITQSIDGANPLQRKAAGLSQNQLSSIRTTHESVARFRATPSGSFWVDMKDNELWENRSSVTDVVRSILSVRETNAPVKMEWQIASEIEDEQARSHIRVHQTYGGVPIKGQELLLHLERGSLRDLNGFAWTAGAPEKLPAPLPATDVLQAAKQYLLGKNVSFQPVPDFPGIHIEEDKTDLIWMPVNGNLVLAYEVNVHPNMLDHWTVYVNAGTLEVMQSISQKCAISPHHLFSKIKSTDLNHNCAAQEEHAEDHLSTTSFLMDGATTTTDQDLLNQNRTVNGYQVGTGFFMIDASRAGMYKSTQSVMPNEPVGVIWTVDAQNSSPSQNNFEIVHATNTNNNWKNLEVSAHYNAGVAYEYFLETFDRNSINGSGGNIISIINVTDENDNNMDNAFWNGSAMFYGNGDVSFKQLARGLDVAGHEMSHGVIQETANLEYIGQSGALNESYADIFGALIDREDWQLGEDVVNLSAFPSGTMRDLSNPNNGGNQLGDPGWQPKHMNEFVSLPNTPEGDNGGVHINSGIPNRAFFILATNVGKEKAEQIYYKALRDYLTKSSQFVDMRLAAEKAATDLHGGASAELDAVRNAFNTVGIGGGQGGDFEDDIETNQGDDFILATDENNADLYWIPPGNPSQFIKMEVPAPISRPSFTDNGVSCVYVDNEQNMILINFDWSGGLDYQAFYLEDSPQGIWRNVVVSKDGSKMAYTTASLTNEILVFDFNTQGNETFILYNPTTANGGATTGDVLYADVMEWDYSGEFIMYDALNRIESNFGDGIEYWDIGFLTAWHDQANTFGSGQISKLFSSLPESSSVGNPTFSKNSPYIITFDFLESYFDDFGFEQTDYYIIAANIEAGVANTIYQNNTVGYPSYSRLDDKILFTYDDLGQLLLATIDVQAADKTLPVPDTDVILITGAQKGVWFVVGNRDFSSTEAFPVTFFDDVVRPQPATDYVEILSDKVVPGTNFQIMDIVGKGVKSGEVSSNNRIQVDDLTSGYYAIRFDLVSGLCMTSRFVKQ